MKLQITYHCDSNVCLLQFTLCCLTKEVSGCVVKAPQMTACQVSLLIERATHPSLQTFENSKILGRSQLKQIRLFKLLLTTDLRKLKSLPTGLFVHRLSLFPFCLNSRLQSESRMFNGVEKDCPSPTEKLARKESLKVEVTSLLEMVSSCVDSCACSF